MDTATWAKTVYKNGAPVQRNGCNCKDVATNSANQTLNQYTYVLWFALFGLTSVSNIDVEAGPRECSRFVGKWRERSVHRAHVQCCSTHMHVSVLGLAGEAVDSMESTINFAEELSCRILYSSTTMDRRSGNRTEMSRKTHYRVWRWHNVAHPLCVSRTRTQRPQARAAAPLDVVWKYAGPKC